MHLAGFLVPLWLLLAGLTAASSATAQDAGTADSLHERPGAAPLGSEQPIDSLVAQALEVNPAIHAASDRLRAAKAAIGPAGARPDPMLMAGLVNFPIADPGFDDFMTMKMIGLGQVFPYSGKLALSRRSAEWDAAAAEARLEGARREVTRQVKAAYYDLALSYRLLEIVEQNRRVLVSLTRTTEASYRVGRAGQQDVLRARVEVARLGDDAAALREQQSATLARLNALLARPSGTPIPGPVVPEHLARAAVAESASAVRFASATLGGRAADSPLPPLEELQALAVRQSAALEAHERMIAAQDAQVGLARKAHLPDFEVSLRFNQRDGFADMVSATVAIPVPLQKGRKYDQQVIGTEATLAALRSEHHDLVNELRARVAALYSDAERDRAQLALYVKAILPQGRGMLESATAGFQVGRADFLTLLDAQATLFNFESQYFRTLTDFARSVAALEEIVGQEILR